MNCENCFEEYSTHRDKQPKVLNCLHTFCSLCCQTIGYKNNGKIIICPLCNNETNLKEKGIGGLQVNYIILRQLEIKRKEELLKSNLKCENCNKSNNAIWRCLTCEEEYANLCEDCKLQHTQMKALRSHNIITINEYKTLTSYIKDKFQCNKHINEELEVYCYDCHQAICLTCAVYDHNNHSRKTIEDGLEIESSDIKQNIYNVTDLYNIYEKETKSVEDISQNLLNQNELIKKNITNTFQELHTMLQER